MTNTRSRILMMAITMAIYYAACTQSPGPNPSHKANVNTTAKTWKIAGNNLIPTALADGGRTEKRCYFDSYAILGSALTECPSGLERSGALCYPSCRDGYGGLGPVCWQKCPPGYSDDGVTCRRNAHIVSADNSKCPWYDKCGLTFAKSCSVCPPGYTNDGCTCRIDANIFGKKTYTRGVGTPMSCSAGKVLIRGLCYSDNDCKTGYKRNDIKCVAITQTCEDVPADPPPNSQLQRFCFKLVNPSSGAQPCFSQSFLADTEDNAKKLAQNYCENCSIERIACEVFDSGKACP